MPVTLMTWRPSALYTTTATVAAVLAALKAAVDAEKVANPATAMWEVADYSAPNGTLILRNTAAGIAAGGSAARRIMFFGGVAPHTDAIDGATATTTGLYVGVAPTSGADIPDQAYSAGAPLTNGQWIAGGLITSTFVGSGTDRIQYYETFAGIFVVFRKLAMTAGNQNLCTAIAGQLGVSMDGETARDIAHGSAGQWQSNVDSASTGSNDAYPTLDPVGSTGYSRMNFGHPADGVQRVRCAQRYIIGMGQRMRGENADRFFLPVLLADSNNDYCRLKLRQIAYGLRAPHGTSVSDAGGIKAYKVAERSDLATDGPWLCQFRV